MKIAICDDVIKDAENLLRIISDIQLLMNTEINIYTSSVELLNKFNNNFLYDVVFLDIDLPDINGIELGKRIRTVTQDTYIVFVTKYPQYAIEAYDCEAFHYLLKPLEPQKVKKVLKSLINSYQKNHAEYHFRTKSGYINIPIKDLYYVECCKKHIIFHMKDRIIESPGKLSEVYSFLVNYDFCQVHQGYIVNMRKIINLNKLNIYLDNNEVIPISQRKKADVLSRYAEYLGENC